MRRTWLEKWAKVFKIMMSGSVIFFSFYENAYAYLNPGAGNILVQILVGGLTGLIIIVKIYWRQVSGFFKNHFVINKEQNKRGG